MSINLDKIVPVVMGARAVAFALVTENTKDSLAFGPVQPLARMKKISMAPTYAEDELDSNDSVEEEGQELTGFDITLDATGVPLETQAVLFGHKLDGKGGMIEERTDEAPEIALLVQLSMSKNNSKYIALYCGKAKQPTEEGETKTKSSFTRSTPSISFSFYAALNGKIRYVVRTDAEGYDETIGNTWFDAVPFPAENASGETTGEG